MYIPLLPFTIPLRMFPQSVHEEIITKVFNHMLRGQTIASRLDEIDGKSVTISIIDIPCEFRFRIQGGRLCTSRHNKGDVVISGNLEAFLRLAFRKEDPDTLFFRRELNIEGETETGVHIKNILDSMEYDLDAHIDAVLFPPLANRVKAFMHIIRRHMPQKLRDFIITSDF